MIRFWDAETGLPAGEPIDTGRRCDIDGFTYSWDSRRLAVIVGKVVPGRRDGNPVGRMVAHGATACRDLLA